jgi:hypothetical protein
MVTERRQLKDRRLTPTKPLGRYTFIGRRRKARRLNEANNYYVDKYELRYLILISLIIVFCILDFYFSFKIYQHGGFELNLMMSIFMKMNQALSLSSKFLITVVGSVFILIHKNFKLFGVIKTNFFIYLIFSIYFVLILYEFYSLVLIARI